MKNFDLRKFLAENRLPEAPVKEMASMSKLESNEDYQFFLNQLKSIVKDEAAYRQVVKIVEAVGELGLDLGYAEAVNDKA